MRAKHYFIPSPIVVGSFDGGLPRPVTSKHDEVLPECRWSNLVINEESTTVEIFTAFMCFYHDIAAQPLRAHNPIWYWLWGNYVLHCPLPDVRQSFDKKLNVVLINAIIQIFISSVLNQIVSKLSVYDTYYKWRVSIMKLLAIELKSMVVNNIPSNLLDSFIQVCSIPKYDWWFIHVFKQSIVIIKFEIDELSINLFEQSITAIKLETELSFPIQQSSHVKRCKKKQTSSHNIKNMGKRTKSKTIQ